MHSDRNLKAKQPGGGKKPVVKVFLKPCNYAHSHLAVFSITSITRKPLFVCVCVCVSVSVFVSLNLLQDFQSCWLYLRGSDRDHTNRGLGHNDQQQHRWNRWAQENTHSHTNSSWLIYPGVCPQSRQDRYPYQSLHTASCTPAYSVCTSHLLLVVL